MCRPGDCWEENGLWEHGVSHPSTLTVPLLMRVRGVPPALMSIYYYFHPDGYTAAGRQIMGRRSWRVVPSCSEIWFGIQSLDPNRKERTREYFQINSNIMDARRNKSVSRST